MPTTFADYAAQQDARNTIHLNIVKYGLMLCDALQQDAPDGYFYSLDSSGRKYHKVFMHIGVDIEPEDYLTMLKDMTYDELVEETCTDDTYHLSEFMEAWG
jgi:hypothetical protein